MKKTVVIAIGLIGLMAHGAASVGYMAATNIAGRVTSNVVTKAYINDLGISGGANTNVVNDLISAYNETNLVGRLALKQDTLADYTTTNAVNNIIGKYNETNLISRLALKQDAIADYTTTNAVCNIVTNDASWDLSQAKKSSEGVYDVWATGVDWNGEIWKISVKGWIDGDNTVTNEWWSNADGVGSTDINALSISEATYGLICTRQSTESRNALGLAYYRELTNAVTKATNALEASGTSRQIVRGEQIRGEDYWYINVKHARKSNETEYDDEGNFIRTTYARKDEVPTAYTNAVKDVVMNATDAGWNLVGSGYVPGMYITVSDPTETIPVYCYWLNWPDPEVSPKVVYTSEGDPPLTRVDFNSQGVDVIATVAYTNLLGLARLDNLPPLTNGLISASTATNIYATKTSVNAVSNTVSFWEGYWQGDRVRLSVTNYYGNTSGDLPRLRIEESITNGSGEVIGWQSVWDENGKYTNLLATVADDIDTATNACRIACYTSLTNETATRAPIAWQSVTSAGNSNEVANSVYMTAPNTVFAGGLEWERVAVGEGSCCLLKTCGAPSYTVGDEGTFKFQDLGGTNYFGFAKTDSFMIGYAAKSIDVANSTVTLTFEITSSGYPCVWWKADLATTNDWEQLNLPDGSAISGASYAVTWNQSPSQGEQECYINVGSAAQGFFKFTYEQAGEAKFITNMKADLAGGILATNVTASGYTTIEPYVENGTVKWRVKQ